MKTKFMVFNDATTPLRIRILDDSVKNRDNYVNYTVIDPHSYQLLDLEIPEDTIPYLKIWDNQIAFLSYVDPNNV